VAVAASVSCGGSEQPLAPTAPAATSPLRAAAGPDVAAATDGFYILVVQCQPKGNKRAHFEVLPASGSAPPVQLRCKGQADMRGPGPWIVRPMADTDQSYVCDPSPITVKEKRKKNRVVCSRG
jgi:hypothetical protein